MQIHVGVIGGSGLETMPIFTGLTRRTVQTAFGAPSAPLLQGHCRGLPVTLLSRHGEGHVLTPSGVNYRANIRALQEAGCTHILATSAVGSLREEIRRGDLVVPDQFIDFTRQRKMTFYDQFEPGNPCHTPMADPFDEVLRGLLIQACQTRGLPHHGRGTVITIEGPRFSTRAESHMFRGFGADIINMSLATETILANEAGVPYAAVAIVTDYDCWKQDEEPVSWEAILTAFQANAANVQHLLLDTVALLARA